MGGKTTQSTQGVTIPPAVLAQYQNVNQKANTTAANPFQQYGGQFVAPVNAQQNTGIAATNAAAGQAQPYFGAATGAITGAQAGVNPVNQAATGLMGQSAEQVNPTNLDAASIDKYLSPYLNTVLGSTESLINQQNQQAQAGQMGTAIQSGAFGGDRSGIAAANLSQQQELAAGNIYSGIANQGYQSALGTAQQQQGVNLAAGQANRAALANAATGLAGIGQTAYGEGANTATTLAGLGTGAQGAALQGAQAQIGAGTLQQQTQQAQDTAQYNQFLQQQSYPFQVDQFLANIAEGTGALSGSTTTTTQPGGFFSDRRLKHDIKKIGKTYDGQHIYSYKMHGDDRTHIGLIAQDVEKKHPEATGVSGHYKVVDYGKATEDAANRGHFYSGGVVPIRAAYAGGGNPMPQYAGMPSAVSPMDLSAILQAQQAMYAPYSGGKGLYGNEGGGPYGGVGHVPPPSGAVSHLVTPQGGLSRQPSVLENTKAITDLVNSGQKIYSDAHRQPSGGQGGGVGDNSFSQNVVDQQGGLVPGPQISDTPITTDVQVPGQWRGGRTGLAQGGMPYSEDPNYTELNIPDTTNSQQLKTAGPLPQQKSGLQNLTSLIGDAAAMYGTYAGVAAAAAAKRGGRIGYADGGAPDDTQLDPIEVDSSAPPPVTTGVAPNTDAPPTPDVQRPADVPMRTAGLAPPDDGGDKRHWYSKAENIVPLLTGLAAMGTAPTRHLGVALSAGLGAGAQTWLPSQELAQQVQQQRISTEMQGMQRDVTKQALTNPQGMAASFGLPGSPAATGVSPTAGGSDYASMYGKKYYVPPILPEEQAAQQRAIAAGVSPVLGNRPKAAVDTAINNRVTSQTSANTRDAQNEFDKQYSIATTSPDANLASDAAARANAVHQWTGDKWIDSGGVVVNSRTGQRPVGGAGQVIPPSAMAALVNSSQELVEVPRSDGSTVKMPRWQANGARSPADYANKIWQSSTVTPGTQGVTQQPSGLAPAPRAAPTPNAAPPTQPTAPIPVRPARQQQLINDLKNPATANAYAPGPQAAPTAGGPAPNTAPDTGQAPMLPGVSLDKLTKTQVAPVVTGTSAGTAGNVKLEATEKARQGQLDEAAAIQKQASENNGLLSEFQSKLSNVNPRDVGPGSQAFKRLMELKTAVTAGAPSDLVDMEVVDKFANQLGVQNVRSLLSGQRITNQEMMNFLTRASASTTQPVDVMKQIIAFQKANNDYDLLKSNTKATALQNPYNADPRKIDGEIENMSHRSDFVHAALSKVAVARTATGPSEGQSGTSKSGKPTIYSGGKWVYQ